MNAQTLSMQFSPVYGRELNTMAFLQGVMDSDKDLTHEEVNRIAKWFHDKYYLEENPKCEIPHLI